VIAGVMITSAIGLLYRAMSMGPMHQSAPLTAVLAAAVPIVAGPLLGESTTALATTGSVIALASIPIISGLFGGAGDEAGTPPARRDITAIALASGLLYGAHSVVLSRASPDSGLWPLAIEQTVGFIGAGSLLLLRRQRLGRPSLAVAGAGVMEIVALSLFLIAVRRGPVATIGLLVALYPASTLVLGRFALGERMSRLQLGGLALASAGVVLIGLGS
jgi:EamA-like transporter family